MQVTMTRAERGRCTSDSDSDSVDHPADWAELWLYQLQS